MFSNKLYFICRSLVGKLSFPHYLCVAPDYTIEIVAFGSRSHSSVHALYFDDYTEASYSPQL